MLFLIAAVLIIAGLAMVFGFWPVALVAIGLVLLFAAFGREMQR